MNKERMLAIARRHGATLMHTQEGHEEQFREVLHRVNCEGRTAASGRQE